MFTNEEIIKIALEQSAIDTNCTVENFFDNKNIVVPFKFDEIAVHTRDFSHEKAYKKT